MRQNRAHVGEVSDAVYTLKDPMVEEQPSRTEHVSRRRAEEWVRAAGAVTIAAGLMVLFIALVVTLTQAQAESLPVFISMVLGVLISLLGVMTLRRRAWGPWATMVIMGLFLAEQFWAAYGGGRKPEGATLSVFLLVVPLIVLIVNTRAIGAIRDLRAQS